MLNNYLPACHTQLGKMTFFIIRKVYAWNFDTRAIFSPFFNKMEHILLNILQINKNSL